LPHEDDRRELTFRSERFGNEPGAYRVVGCDRAGNGADLTISATSAVHVEIVELAFAAQTLKGDWQWQRENHDTGFLRWHPASFPKDKWVAEPRPNSTTGKNDAF